MSNDSILEVGFIIQLSASSFTYLRGCFAADASRRLGHRL